MFSHVASPEDGIQTFIDLSPPQLQIRPSVNWITGHTQSVCPVNVFSQLPEIAFQILIDLSEEAETMFSL